jgi:hypothetical protein
MASSNLLPINLLAAYTVFSGFVMAYYLKKVEEEKKSRN